MFYLKTSGIKNVITNNADDNDDRDNNSTNKVALFYSFLVAIDLTICLY